MPHCRRCCPHCWCRWGREEDRSRWPGLHAVGLSSSAARATVGSRQGDALASGVVARWWWLPWWWCGVSSVFEMGFGSGEKRVRKERVSMAVDGGAVFG
ncbi:hypothetical protein Droror1_Dr00000101 [Drosera rotundifolia]